MIIGLVGIGANSKSIEFVEALAGNPAFNQCLFHILAPNDVSHDTLEKFNAYDNVSTFTDITDFEYHNHLAKLKILVDYRQTYEGEVSLITLWAMSHGVVPVVRNIGWYAELPDDTAIKVVSLDELFLALSNLVGSPNRQQAMGLQAKEYVLQNHSAIQYVADLKKMIERNAESRSLNTALADSLKTRQIKSPKQYYRFLKERL